MHWCMHQRYFHAENKAKWWQNGSNGDIAVVKHMKENSRLYSQCSNSLHVCLERDEVDIQGEQRDGQHHCKEERRSVLGLVALGYCGTHA